MTSLNSRPSRQRGDATADAGSYGAGMSGASDAAAGRDYATAAPTFVAADGVITQNVAGGAGYYAEAHHTASLNIDANYREVGEHATRLGSTAFGSPDIRLDTGELYNPKFYDTARGSYDAGAMMIDGHAKYAGQTILVPQDQLDAIKQFHQDAIVAAHNLGDSAREATLQSVSFDDHIHAHGAESLPLTYDDAQRATDEMRHGALPDFAGRELNVGASMGDGALLAAAMAVASSAGPEMLSAVSALFRRKCSKDDAVQRVQQALARPEVRHAMTLAAARGSGAAGLTALGAMDPLGAAVVVNVLIDVTRLTKQLQKHEITGKELRSHMLATVADRSIYGGLTAGAVFMAGPIGLLAPIIIRRVVRTKRDQRTALRAWHKTSETMHREMALRLGNVALLDKIDAHYRRAAVSTGEANSCAASITEKLQRARCALISYTPLPAPAP